MKASGICGGICVRISHSTTLNGVQSLVMGRCDEGCVGSLLSRECYDNASLPDVGHDIVCIAVVCYEGECLYALWTQVFEINVADVVWSTGR